MKDRLRRWNQVAGLVAHAALSLLLILGLVYLWVVSMPGRISIDAQERDALLRHLRGVEDALHRRNAAEEMQQFFPEGACFFVTLYGLSWANAMPVLTPEERAHGLVEIRHALDEQESRVVVAPFVDTQVRRGVFWLGQRNLLLGRYLALLPEAERPEDLVEEFHRNAGELADAFLVSPTHHLDSYPGMCWPADNVTALASLHIHDGLYGSDHIQAYEAWKDWTRGHGDNLTGMPMGHLYIDTGQQIESARGCANSWIISLIAEMDPDYARVLYGEYKKHFGIERLGFPMFREWPEGEPPHPGDVDSGPIVWGAGVTATGVGLAAARSQDDRWTEAGIRDLSRLLGFPRTELIDGQPATSYLFKQLPIGDAFLTYGYSISRPNDGSAPSPSFIGRLLDRWQWIGLLCLATLLVIGQWIWGYRRGMRRLHMLTADHSPCGIDPPPATAV